MQPTSITINRQTTIKASNFTLVQVSFSGVKSIEVHEESFAMAKENLSLCVGGSKGGAIDWVLIFHFHAFWGENWPK